MTQNITTALDANGVLLATIDMPGRTMNVFSLDMMDSLEQLIAQVEKDDAVKAVVLTSGKSAFLAGADLDMIRMFTERARTDTHAQLFDLCGHLGRIFRRLEKCTKPFVAAVNGLALGGGLEVSLSCHSRVVADDRKVMLGLPEIKLGLLPGAGGTQRLPRLVGMELGLRMLLVGDPLTPAQALECGLVDEVVAPENLIEAAKKRAVSLAASAPKAPWDRGVEFSSAPFDFTKDDVHQQIAKALGISDHQLANYPAYTAIINCVAGGWGKPMDDAGFWEMDRFVELIRDPSAGNLVRTLFLNRQRAAKAAPKALSAKTAGVIVFGEGAAAVEAQLDRAKARRVTAAELAAQDVAITLGGAKASGGIAVALSQGANAVPGAAGATVWISDSTDQGVAAEVFVANADDAATDAGLVVAQWFRASPLVTSGKTLLLPQLKAARTAAKALGLAESDELLAVSLAAVRVWGDGGVSDTDLADVAAVIGGLHAAYTGGPYNYLRQLGGGAVRARAAAAEGKDAKLFAVPACIDAFFGIK